MHFGRVSACGSSGTGQSQRCVGALGTACACVHKLASRIDRIGLQKARGWLGDCKARRQAEGACASGERATRRPIRRFVHSCAQAAEEKFHGARTILFMIGGMTYSEMRTAYDFSEQHNREAIVGAPAALRSTYHCRFMEGVGCRIDSYYHPAEIRAKLAGSACTVSSLGGHQECKKKTPIYQPFCNVTTAFWKTRGWKRSGSQTQAN